MPKIYELLGYPVEDHSPSVVESRKRAYCPFISDKCDGGGNRHMSDIELRDCPEMQALFPGLQRIPSGVCSIQVKDNEAPWIICPRRLFYMGKYANESILRGTTQSILLDKCGFNSGDRIGIWTETKIKYESDDAEDDLHAFDYTFDYILMPIGRVKLSEAVCISGVDNITLEKNLRDAGYTFALRGGEVYLEDFPIGTPVIVEVMTSSTSGGNKRKRSCIPQALEDCMLGKDHLAPGINYRQVWARMASQLIVKSQVALEWGGRTIWVLQDVLAEYISSSTALDLHRLLSEYTNEVNILAFSYANKHKLSESGKVIELSDSALYAGPIKAGQNNNPEPCFQDIVLAAVCPPKSVLISALCKKTMANQLVI